MQGRLKSTLEFVDGLCQILLMLSSSYCGLVGWWCCRGEELWVEQGGRNGCQWSLLQLWVHGVDLLLVAEEGLAGSDFPHLWVLTAIEARWHGLVELGWGNALSKKLDAGLMVLFLKQKLLNLRVKNFLALSFGVF